MPKLDQRGTEEQFVNIVKLLANNAKKYDDRTLAHRGYSEEVDNILANNNWGKLAFHEEMKSRTEKLGLSMRSAKVRRG